MREFNRRRILQTGVASAALSLLPRAGWTQEGKETETHGLSSFGELKYPLDFKHFDYVNPAAPKGGTLAIQIKQTYGNQNFDTFNTLNTFVLRGDGAAGMASTFDRLLPAWASSSSAAWRTCSRRST